MAEKKEATTKKAGGKKTFFISLAVVILIFSLGGGFGAWYFMKVRAGLDQKKDPAQQVPVPALTQQAQIGPMVNIDEFIVNIISGEAAHYVKASLTFELTNDQVKAEVEQRMPQVRDAILLLIGNKTYEELQDLQGKKQLKAELLEKINTFLQTGKVASVFFTNFVVQ